MNNCGVPTVISDPLYEEAINELIEAGNILVNCKHNHGRDENPCDLCRETWNGVVDNARAIMKGKKILTNRAHGE